MTEKKTLLDALNRLLPSQFEEFLFHYEMPSHSVSSGTQMERAISVIKFAEERYFERDDFPQLREVIEKIAGASFLPPAESISQPKTRQTMPTNTQEAVQPKEPLKLFYSYSHADEALRDKLAKHLKILQRQNIIAEWHDRAIEAGEEWEGEIVKAMNEAQIVLLLISDDFIASDYCWGPELTASLAKHESGEARVIPVILRAVDWTGAPFSKLQALPKNAKPITTWSDIDEAMTNVAEGIRRVAQHFKPLK